jgi:proline dehydrogenase
MEKERKRAEDIGYDDPIQPDKPTTDDDFNRSMIYTIDNLDIFAICLGTHNEDSCKLCIETMQLRGIMPTDERVFFAQLLGMSDNISYGVASAGFNSAKYVPYGPVETVMPYLLRRSEENTSVSGQSSREFLLVKNEVKRRKAR